MKKFVEAAKKSFKGIPPRTGDPEVDVRRVKKHMENLEEMKKKKK